MLSFDIRALESKAVQVDADLAANDSVWDTEDPRPDEGIHVEGRLSAAGDDRFYFNGHISGAVKLDCRRCLADVTVEVKEAMNALFAPTGDPAAEDDPDVFLYDTGGYELDIRAAVRETWLLGVPAFVQCKPDCKGLCPQCGTDLNTGACDCVPVNLDSRWDTLRDL
jgi:uncharacterized protein